MKLLVSVVSADEARRALAGGADIIDVKDPAAGPLGAPAPPVVAEVVYAVDGHAPVSVALGDVPNLSDARALTGAAYVKVGLREVGDLDAAAALVAAVAAGVGGSVEVVAVAYADAGALDPPALAPGLLPALVQRTGIAGALVDTYTKDGRGLYGWLGESALAELVARTRAAGAMFGVAGQLRLGELCRVRADVVGLRSAVCHGGDRGAAVRTELVAAAVAEVRAGGIAQAHPGQPGVRRVPAPAPGARMMTVTPVRRTASGR